MKCSPLLLLPLALWAPAAHGAHAEPAEQERLVITISPQKDLGRVLFVGDSITHGKSSGSWRWELFKILVDNGIKLEEVGLQSGNYNGRGEVAPGTRYRGRSFANRHAAQFSLKAAEAAGRVSVPSRLGGTGIRHWLRLDGAAESAWQLPKCEMPDTVFIALGTNDFVAEHSREPGGLAEALPAVQAQLIGRQQGAAWDGSGDLDAVVAAVRAANPRARLVVIGIPTWGDGVGRWCHKAISAEDYAAVAAFNQKLLYWGAANKLRVLDVNEGFRDVARGGAAVPGMLVDQMHPNAQGNLIYAGNVASLLGYAGRTAGLPRRAAAELPGQSKALMLNRGSGFSGGGSLTRSGGVTLEFYFAENGGYGNGAEGGWNDIPPMQVSLCNGQRQGCLRICESALCWGELTLYSADMSQGLRAQPIRMAWVAGDARNNIAEGFYVWLGEQLIGEALPGEALPATQGEWQPSFSFFSPMEAQPTAIGPVSYDFGGSWAPPATGLSAGRDSKTNNSIFPFLQ